MLNLHSKASSSSSNISPVAGCVASRGLGDAQRASLHYFAGLVTEREEAKRGESCAWLVVQTGPADKSDVPGWTRQWEGMRPGDSGERFRLYRRDGG